MGHLVFSFNKIANKNQEPPVIRARKERKMAKMCSYPSKNSNQDKGLFSHKILNHGLCLGVTEVHKAQMVQEDRGRTSWLEGLVKPPSPSTGEVGQALQ
jgi:hypothetical protein